MKKQHTLAKSAVISGIALHTGARAKLRLQPAEANTGIRFRRIDIPGAPDIPALFPCVVDTQRGTTIAISREVIVYTVEHIMSALHGCGVDNCIVEMDGLEAPIADGSSLPYVQIIQEAGLTEQDFPVRTFTPPHILTVDEGESKLVFIPGKEKLKISCVTSFAGCPFDPQFYEYELDSESYVDEIAPGRTFVNYSDLKQLLAAGLVKGGSLDAAAIIHDGAIICNEKLRFQNEIVRHKILDVIGDLYLAGCRVTGTLIAIRPGHHRNVALAGQMFNIIKSAMENK